jgi:hypothetical protein
MEFIVMSVWNYDRSKYIIYVNVLGNLSKQMTLLFCLNKQTNKILWTNAKFSKFLFTNIGYLIVVTAHSGQQFVKSCQRSQSNSKKMKVLLLISVFLLATAICDCDAGCKFRIANATYKPLVFERHGSNYRFLNIKEDIVYVPTKNFVIATCQHSGFTFSSWPVVSSVKLFCSKNSNRYIAYDNEVRKYNSEEHQLSCNSAVIQHYPSQVRGCDKLGVVAAYANMVSFWKIHHQFLVFNSSLFLSWEITSTSQIW